MTPDAVLHRYVELTSEPDIGVDDLYRLVSTDADLLHRYVGSLGCLVDPEAIQTGLRALDRTMLHGLARAHTWAVAPLGGAARQSFIDQPTQSGAEGEHSAGGDDQRRRGERDGSLVRRQKSQQAAQHTDVAAMRRGGAGAGVTVVSQARCPRRGSP